jgi:ComF family protein
VSLHFESARSAVEYAPPFRELIHQFKFRGSERVQPILIEWFLKGAARDFRENDFDCVVPVPLHWWRRFQREFNQAEVLGTALAEEWSVPLLTKALRRRRATVAQSKLPGKWREKNITKAFGPGKESVAGRRVLLVDDVMTTGATLSECAGVLMKAGAESVKAYTLARRF